MLWAKSHIALFCSLYWKMGLIWCILLCCTTSHLVVPLNKRSSKAREPTREYSISKRKYKGNQLNISEWMNMVCCGSITVMLYPRIGNSKINSWMKLTFLSYLSILEVAKCITIWDHISSGQKWRRRLQPMLLDVTHVAEWRPYIWNRLVCYSRY